MKTVIRLSFLPPSVNHIWRHGRNRVTGKPQTYRTSEYTTWLRSVEWEAKAQAVKQPKWTTPVYMTVAIKRPRSNADVDNRIKPLADLMQHVGVLENDKLIHGVNIYWSEEVDTVEIAITAAEPLSPRQKDAA